MIGGNQERRPVYNPESETTNYIPAITGEVLVEIAAINPTKEEISKVTGRPIESINDEPVYVDVVDKNGKVNTVLTFLLKYTPSTQIKESVKSDYTLREHYFANYTIYLSSEITFNKDKTKVQVIDDRNLSTWIPYKEGSTAKELFQEEINRENSTDENSKKSGYLKLFNKNTVRFARQGEVHLMNFIFNCTWLMRHNTEIKKGDSEPEIIELSDFVLNKNGSSPEKATEGFLDIVNGDVSYLKEILFKSDICKDDSGKQLKIGVLYGASITEDKTKAYQRVYNPRLSCSTFKQSVRPKKSMINEQVVDARLNSETVNNLNNKDYPWDCYYEQDLIPTCFYLDSYLANMKPKNTTSIFNNNSTMSALSDNPFATGESTNADDDLPF